MNALQRIEAYKRYEIAQRKQAIPLSDLDALARSALPVRGFAKALKSRADEAGLALIAEVKKASPSKGLIREDFDPPALARAYEAAGAACLSVLTDSPSFQGHEDYLRAARAATALPVLRKDFMLDPWQVTESRAMGADAILVILASVDDALAGELVSAARDWGMDALIETHDRDELERALRLDSPLVGINNRNLATFETSLETFETLATLIPSDRIAIAESGIASRADAERVQRAGASAILVGESLMRQADVERATQALLSSFAFT